MKMRPTRKVAERQYLPWDPLQLSTSIDGGQRVRKNHVNFSPFRAFKRTLIWTALQDKNFLCFSEDDSYTDKFLKQLFHRLKPLRESVTVSCYDFTGKKEKELLSFDDDYTFITYHPYNESFSHFLSEVLKHRALIRKEVEKTDFIEAENKELQFLFVFLPPSLIKELLGNTLLLNMFTSLLQESYRERIYLCLFTELTSDVKVSFMQDFSQVYFLGENTAARAEEIFPQWPVTRNSFSQEYVGCGIFNRKEELVSLHWPDFTLSEWGKDFRAKKEEEEKLYREFLKSKADK